MSRRKQWLFAWLAIVASLLLFFMYFASYQLKTAGMHPTLSAGDRLLVNRLAYGLRMPFVHTKILSGGHVVRGDILVFEGQDELEHAMRAIGLPGDVIDYRDKQLFINGVEQKQKSVPRAVGIDSSQSLPALVYFDENLFGRHYLIAQDRHRPVFDLMMVATFHERGLTNFPENCRYDVEQARWFVCTVPPGHYFVLGDNRDHSVDGRYWGFIPDRGLIGRAVNIWLKGSPFVGARGMD